MYSFNAPDAPSRRTHQLFEMQGNVALYADGWWANSKPTRAPWDFAGKGGLPTEGPWELYNIASDFSQSTDLAARDPDRLKAMQDRFWTEAADGQVLPIDNRSFARWDTANRPSLLGDRTRFNFGPSPRRITGGAFPDLSGRSWQVAASIEIPRAGAGGTIVMNGSNSVGWALALDAGRPIFAYKASDAPDDLTRITAPAALAPGRHEISVVFETSSAKGPGQAQLLADGRSVGSATIPHVVPVLIPDNATVGWSFDAIDAATPSAPFTGEIRDVTVELSGSGK
jgi:arylsulfatase